MFQDHDVELWSEDEYRLHLKPIIRKAWSPYKGRGPRALRPHRETPILG